MTEYNEPSFPGIFREAETLDQKTLMKKLLTVLAEWQFNIKVILNRGISLSDNVDMVDIEFTSSATPDAENTVSHTLGKVPTGFIVYSKDKGGVVYDGTTAWTASNIYLKCTAASTVIKAKVF